MNIEAEILHEEPAAPHADTALLQEQLAAAHARLEQLGGELAAVDAELETHAGERRRHELLEQACRALEKLHEAGGADLFWEGLLSVDARGGMIARARGRNAEAQARIGEIDARRRALVERIGEQNQEIYLLEDEAFEHQEEIDRINNEWIVERELEEARARPHLMPWVKGEEDDRHRKWLLVALAIWLLLLIAFPFLKGPEKKQDLEDKVERVVTVIPETKKLELPPPPPEPKKVPEKKQEQKPQPTPQPKPDQVPQPEQKEQPKPQGLLAMKDQLKDIDVDEPQMANLGKQAKLSNDAGPASAQRNMLTTNAAGSSGGINLSQTSRGLGGGGSGGGERGSIQGGALTKASSGINAIAAAAASKPLGGASKGRSSEEIQTVFDRYKAALYRIYQRELRVDETLQGKVILKLTIEPDGSVSMCVVQSSEMNDKTLLDGIVERVKGINFGAKDVPAVTIVYPMSFLPAG